MADRKSIGATNELGWANKDKYQSMRNIRWRNELMHADIDANGNLRFKSPVVFANSISGVFYNVQNYGAAADGTDDSSAIQDTIDAVETAGGGVVYFPAGTYGVSGQLNIADNVMLWGDGWGSILSQLEGGGSSTRTININGDDNVVVRNLCINHDGVVHAAGEWNHAIRITDSTNIIINNVKVIGPAKDDGASRGDGIYVSGTSSNIAIDNCLLQGNSRNGIAVVEGTNIVIRGCRITGENNEAGIDLEPNAGETVQYVLIDDCYVDHAIGLVAAGTTKLVSDIQITNSKCLLLRVWGNVHHVEMDGCELAGSYSYSGWLSAEHRSVDAAYRSTDIVVKNTKFARGYLQGVDLTVENCIIDATGQDYGLDDNSMSGRLTVRGCEVKNATLYGIFGRSASMYSISNCNIHTNGDGIRLQKGTTVMDINDCDIHDNTTYGVHLDSGANARINLANCRIYSNTSDGVHVVEANKLKLVGCHIYNNGVEGIQLQPDDPPYQHLREVDFATHDNWDVTNDFDNWDSNEYASYVWSSNQTSTLVQTAANRRGTLLNLVPTWFTYTVGVTTAPDGDFALTLENVGESSVTLDHTAGTHTVRFISAADADTSDCTIQAVVSTGTEGTITIDDVYLYQSKIQHTDIIGCTIEDTRQGASRTQDHGVRMRSYETGAVNVADTTIRNHTQYGILDNTSWRLRVSNCQIERNTLFGISIANTYLEEALISNNIIRKNSNRGLRVDNNTATVIIQGNEIIENGSDGVRIDHADELIINSNVFRDNAGIGCSIHPGSNDDVKYLALTGNQAIDTGVATQTYGIWLRGADITNSIVSDNYAVGNTTQQIYITATGVVYDTVNNVGLVTIRDFTAADTTPSVRRGNLFRTQNTGGTTITDFDDGTEGKTIRVIIGDAFTTIDFTGSSLKGNAGVDWSPGNGDWMECTLYNNNWYCSVHDCTA
jgi:parallel beta-helix repeat protein